MRIPKRLAPLLECGVIDRVVRPLLSGKEAVELLRRGSRCVGGVSHGWLSPDHPDPGGVLLATLQRALERNDYIEAIVWDYASLCALPRARDLL